jgi:lysophospholipase L1-like esterase
MNRQNRFVVLLSMMVVLALLAACGTPQPTATMVPTSEPAAIPTDTPPAPAEAEAGITVTFDGDKCVFHGPERVPAGRIPIVLDVKDQTAHESYGVQVLTMDEGHTIEELVTYQEQISLPLWAHDHGFLKAAQGTTEERTIVLFEGPLFLTCFTNTADESQTEYAGILGPIAIEPAASNGGAQATPPVEGDAAITVSFEGDECLIDAPERVPAGKIPIALDVRDQTAHESYGVQVLTMDEGHTIEELVTYQEQISFPLWAHDHGFLKAAQGTTEERTIVLFEGPLFLTCFTNTADETQTEYAGILGPIEIEPMAGFPTGRLEAENADWVLLFDNDGSFTFSESGAVAASGTFSIQANELTWETDSGCEGLGQATYTWTFENDTLLFQVKGGDECASRLGVLDGISYHASPEPTAVPSAGNATTAIPESGDTTWDMVVLGDSLVAADYSVLPEAYADRIEEDLGVEVEIQNLAVGGETSESLLTNVRKYPWYREPIQEAEVILISAGGGDLPRMEKRFFGGESGPCGGADNQDCLRQQLEESEANWDALLDEITSLTKPGQTLIRPIIPGVLEYYARLYKDQPEDVEVYNSYVVALYEHMAQSCAERGIPVLDLYALYDGPNADPSLPEIAGTGDGVHVSDEGDAVIADLLRDLGYAPINLVTNAEALSGVWHRTTPDSFGAEVYRQYRADGTYRMGRSPEELEAQPRVEGEFWFEGDQIVMRDVTALPSYDLCVQAGQVGCYTVQRLANGHIRFVEVEDACRDRARMLGTGEMERVR